MSAVPQPPYKNPREFLVLELHRVVSHFTIIYETRDRFFNNFMSVSIALFGFLGYMFKEAIPSAGAIRFSASMLLTLAIFGTGTLFLNTANWLARDFYRQRRAKIHELLLQSDDVQLESGVTKYLEFSRDKTKWHYRPTSIYFIYNTAIALINGIGLTFAVNIMFPRVTWPQMALMVTALVLLQHAGTMVYLWVYRCGTYREG